MTNISLKQFKLISPYLARKTVFILLVVIIFDFFMFPAPILASNSEKNISIDGIIKYIDENLGLSKRKFVNTLPENSDLQLKTTGNYTITAYTSEVAQCDSTPCITANGFNVCEHATEDTVAANFLPLGSKVRIPDLFGDKVFVVRDRMNKRYQNRLDVWMINKGDAINFGVKVAKVEILE